MVQLQPRLELLFLGLDDAGDAPVGQPALDEFGIEVDRLQPVAFGREAALAGEDLEPLALDDAELGDERRAVEAHQNVACGHLVAITGVDLGDDATVRVLDHLAVALDLDDARGDDGARDLRHSRPGTDAEDEEEERGVTHQQEVAVIPAVALGPGVGGPRCHDWVSGAMRPATWA